MNDNSVNQQRDEIKKHNMSIQQISTRSNTLPSH